MAHSFPDLSNRLSCVIISFNSGTLIPQAFASLMVSLSFTDDSFSCTFSNL